MDRPPRAMCHSKRGERIVRGSPQIGRFSALRRNMFRVLWGCSSRITVLRQHQLNSLIDADAQLSGSDLGIGRWLYRNTHAHVCDASSPGAVQEIRVTENPTPSGKMFCRHSERAGLRNSSSAREVQSTGWGRQKSIGSPEFDRLCLPSRRRARIPKGALPVRNPTAPTSIAAGAATIIAGGVR